MVNKVLKTTEKISLFLVLLGMAFGMYSPVAHAQLNITTGHATNVDYKSTVLTGYFNEVNLPITAWFELGTSTSSLNLSTEQKYYNSLSTVFNAAVSGLQSNTTYYFRAVGQNFQGKLYGNILSFATAFDTNQNTNSTYDPYYLGSKPMIITTGITNITSTSGILNGYVSANNLSTNAWFEWGTTPNFGNSTTQNYYGFNGINYNITLNNLSPNTTYYFRAVGQNMQGRVFGNVNSFTTSAVSYVNSYINTPINNQPVSVVSSVLSTFTTPATNVYSTSAELNALIVNANTTPSNTYFEWGTDNTLGNTTKIISTGTLPRVRHVNTITGLKPNTTYYFRAVAENGYTKNTGEIIYFITNTATVNTTPNEINTPTITEVKDTTDIGLGASAFSAGFFPHNLFGWLLFVILILLLMLLAQHLFIPATHKEHGASHH